MILKRRSRPVSAGGAVRFSETLDLPRDEAFRLLRDHLPEVAKHIPDVTSITCLERTERDGEVLLRNRWRGDAQIPRIARPFIKPELLTWIDENTWSERDWTCSWRFVAPSPFTDAIRCEGVNHYEELPGGRCQLRSEGRLQIDPSKIPGVPKIFHRVGRDLENWLAKLASPRVAQLAEGVRGHLRSR
jgi:hypothetical protein